MLAGLGNSAHDPFGHFRVEFADSQVIHEEKRGRALHDNVVDAVIHQVAADGVVQVHLEGEFQLGADAVDAGDEDGILEFLLVDLKQAAESANFAEYVLVERAMSQVLDALLGAIGSFYVDAGVGVSEAFLFLFHALRQANIRVIKIGLNGNCTIVSVAFDLLAISTADTGSLNHARWDVFRLLAPFSGHPLLLNGCHRNVILPRRPSRAARAH